MRGPFRAAFGLAIFPDFTEVEAGRKPAPYVDHDRLDYNKLQDTLEKLFVANPGRIRLANDTIDQVTLQIRMGLVPPEHVKPCKASKGPENCSDFGKAMIRVARAQPEGLLNVRESWSKLHYLPDRTFSPPPSLIPFIIETGDFVDAMMWLHCAQAELGLNPRLPGLDDDDDELPRKTLADGKLPPDTLAAFESLFGIPYEERAILVRMAFSSVPAYIKQLEAEGKVEAVPR